VRVNKDNQGNTILDSAGRPSFTASPEFSSLRPMNFIAPITLLFDKGGDLLESVDRHSRYIDGIEFQKTEDIDTIQRLLQ
jgi:hypothetical protein